MSSSSMSPVLAASGCVRPSCFSVHAWSVPRSAMRPFALAESSRWCIPPRWYMMTFSMARRCAAGLIRSTSAGESAPRFSSEISSIQRRSTCRPRSMAWPRRCRRPPTGSAPESCSRSGAALTAAFARRPISRSSERRRLSSMPWPVSSEACSPGWMPQARRRSAVSAWTLAWPSRWLTTAWITPGRRPLSARVLERIFARASSPCR